MLEICRKVPLKPAETFAEAVQAMWTVKVAIEIAHPVYLHCLGRVDQDLRPYYEKDVAEGRITREAAVELCAELLLKAMSQNIRPESNILSNFYHRFLGSTPITLAGITRDGEDAANELTYVFLEAAEPVAGGDQVSVRVHAKRRKRVLLTVAEYLHRGASSFSIFADEMNIEAMKRRGFAQDDANDYAVMGCVETNLSGQNRAR